jgi:hypothetical protein
LLNEFQELSNLVRLRLTSVRLNVEQLGNSWMHVDMMAAAHSLQTKPKSLDEIYKISERDVVDRSAG